jgi:hypothetical protein
MRQAFGNPERRRDNIHFSITYQDVAVTPEPLDALVFVDIFVIRVQEVAVTNDEIEDGIAVAVRIFGVSSSEYIIDCSPVMKAGRDLAVAIKTRVPAGVGKPFQFISLCRCDHPKVRIGISSADLVIESPFLKAFLEPVLKMEFFVGAADTFDQNAFPNRKDTPLEDF